MYEITHRASQALYENVRSHLNNLIMDKINIFDRYIRGEMTPKEVILFKQQLIEDAETNTDFKIYSALVAGICKEEQQDNIDFAYALKSLTEERLKQVIGKRVKTRLQKHSFRQIGLWVASMVAIVVFCFSVTLHIQNSAEYTVDNLIVEYNSMPVSNRGGDNAIDISNMNQDEVENIISKLCNIYSDISKEDIQEKQMAGINLAMAYLKIHDRKKAISVLEEIKSLYPDDTEFVFQCDKILKRLK